MHNKIAFKCKCNYHLLQIYGTLYVERSPFVWQPSFQQPENELYTLRFVPGAIYGTTLKYSMKNLMEFLVLRDADVTYARTKLSLALIRDNLSAHKFDLIRFDDTLRSSPMHLILKFYGKQERD